MAHRHSYRVTSVPSPAPKLPEPNRALRLMGAKSEPAVTGGLKDMSDLRPVPNGQPPLDEYYNSLFTAFGPQHWWPGKTRFEVIVGAILTQNTSWTNVERAISNLRSAGLLSPAAIGKAPAATSGAIGSVIRVFPAEGAEAQGVLQFLRNEYGGSLKTMFETPTIVLREKLLGVFGIGPETADSILLYAGEHPVFVVDAYTKRMLARHGWIDEKAKYEDVRWMFERAFSGRRETIQRVSRADREHREKLLPARRAACGDARWAATSRRAVRVKRRRKSDLGWRLAASWWCCWPRPCSRWARSTFRCARSRKHVRHLFCALDFYRRGAAGLLADPDAQPGAARGRTAQRADGLALQGQDGFGRDGRFACCPWCFLFFFSYALVNRTLNHWFPHPLEIANEQSQILLTHFETTEFDRLNQLAAEAAFTEHAG